MLFESCDDIAYRKQEDARVPQVAAIRQHLYSAVMIGFFDKAVQGNRRAGLVGCLAELQVAVPGLGPIRSYAKSYKIAPCLDHSDAFGNGVMKRGLVGRNVI